MQFNRNRLLELSGISADNDAGMLSESKRAQSSKKAVNASSSPDTLVETRLRAAIRKEISSILEDLEAKGGNSKWMHKTLGQPQNSKTGRVTRGFLGLGFK